MDEILRRQIYISTSCFLSRGLDEILLLCEQYRINALELSMVDSYDLAVLESTKFPRHYLIHNYFPPPSTPFLLNLASQNKDVLTQSRVHCRNAIDLSSRLHSNLFAAHAGFAMDLPPDILGKPEQQGILPNDRFSPYEQIYATLLDSARSLTDYAKNHGIRFLIENNVLSSLGGIASRNLLPMVEADELLRLAKDIGDSNFGLLVDVGHLKVSAHTLGFGSHQFIDSLAPYINAFHLSDNDGVTDQHLPFGNDAWFLPRLRDFPSATITIEFSKVDIDRIICAMDIVMEWS